jgi:hypothetical protein
MRSSARFALWQGPNLAELENIDRVPVTQVLQTVCNCNVLDTRVVVKLFERLSTQPAMPMLNLSDFPSNPVATYNTIHTSFVDRQSVPGFRIPTFYVNTIAQRHTGALH